jgi:hypothetical protein
MTRAAFVVSVAVVLAGTCVQAAPVDTCAGKEAGWNYDAANELCRCTATTHTRLYFPFPLFCHIDPQLQPLSNPTFTLSPFASQALLAVFLPNIPHCAGWSDFGCCDGCGGGGVSLPSQS